MTETFSPPYAMKWEQYMALRNPECTVWSTKIKIGSNIIEIEADFDKIAIQPDTWIYFELKDDGKELKEIIKGRNDEFIVINTLKHCIFAEAIDFWIRQLGVAYAGQFESICEKEAKSLIKRIVKKEERLKFDDYLIRSSEDHTANLFVKTEKGGKFYLYREWGTYSGREKTQEKHENILLLFKDVYEQEKLRIVVDE